MSIIFPINPDSRAAGRKTPCGVTKCVGYQRIRTFKAELKKYTYLWAAVGSNVIYLILYRINNSQVTSALGSMPTGENKCRQENTCTFMTEITTDPSRICNLCSKLTIDFKLHVDQRGLSLGDTYKVFRNLYTWYCVCCKILQRIDVGVRGCCDYGIPLPWDYFV